MDPSDCGDIKYSDFKLHTTASILSVSTIASDSNDSGYDSDDSDASFATAMSHEKNCKHPDPEESTRTPLQHNMVRRIVGCRPRMRGLPCLPALHQCIPRLSDRAIKRAATVQPQPMETAERHQQESVHDDSQLIDLGWAVLTVTCGADVDGVQLPDSERDMRLIAKDAPFTNDAPAKTCSFIRNLLTTSSWPYKLTYDFRAMRMPSASFICQMGALGKEPEMLKICEERCRACKIILSPGPKFAMMKFSISAFFKIMPPVCRTYLLTEDGDPAPDAVYFDPPVKSKDSCAAVAGAKVLVNLPPPRRDASRANANAGGVGMATLHTDGPAYTERVHPVMLQKLAEAAQVMCPGGLLTIGSFTSS